MRDSALQLAVQPTLARCWVPLTLSRCLYTRSKHIYIDLGAQRGASVQKFVMEAPDSIKYEIHAFEPSPSHMPALRAFSRGPLVAGRITVHPEAAWNTATKVRRLNPRQFQKFSHIRIVALVLAHVLVTEGAVR